MERHVRVIEGRDSAPLVIVTTRRSVWNPLNWFSGIPLVHTVAYRRDGNTFTDLHGNSVNPDISRDILDKLGG